MPIPIRLLTPTGLELVPYSAESLADAAQYEPKDGVYTITNTFNTTQVLKLDAHLDRLEDSARRAGIDLKLDRPRLRQKLRKVIEEANLGSVRFRLTVGRETPEHILISIEPFTPPPPEIYNEGVRCVTMIGFSRSNPAAKTTDWMHSRASIQRGLPEGAYEGLLLSEKAHILEGLSSNFYAIQDGKLYIADEGVLPGIGQQIVLEIAPAIIPVVRGTVHWLAPIDESFITSASRGIIPVIKINDDPIGGGTPGPITRALREAYLEWVDEHLEEI